MDSPTVENLLALAIDVLAQSEARQRAARRLHQAATDLTQTVRITGGCDALQMQRLLDQSSAIRDLSEVERTLLEELDAAVSDLAG